MATPRYLLDIYRAKYSALVQAVMEAHRKHTKNLAHDWYHALLAAQYAVVIAADPRAGELAWIACLCHATDHLFGKDRVEERMQLYLSLCSGLSDPERQELMEAVKNHGKRNAGGDSEVIKIVRDCDKLANLDAVLASIRYGQQSPKVTAVNPRYITRDDPAATFKNPLTVWRDLKYALEWEEPGWFRCPKAMPIAANRFAALKAAMQDTIDQFTETGLDDLPEELVVVPQLSDEQQPHI